MILCKCGCGQEVKEGKEWVSGHNSKIYNSNKNPYPSIPDLCYCGCGQIVWNGKQWVNGHNSNNKNNGMYGKHHSEETKRKIGEANSNPSIETRQKISIANIGRIVSEDTKNKHSKRMKGNQYRKGIKHTKETKDKMSKAQIGRKPSMLGKHHSKETKERWSKIRKGKNLGKNSPRYGKVPPPSSNYGKRCYYESSLQGLICFRSSFELAYAKYLDENKILWMYEEFTFELSDELTYTPDFFLPKFEKFVEIKGYMRKDAKCKVDKFKEEYPFDLEILYKEDLIKLGCNI